MNVRNLLAARTLSISVPTTMLGTGDPQMSQHSPSSPLPAKCFLCIESFSAMALDLSFHPCPNLSLSLHIVLPQNVPESPQAKRFNCLTNIYWAPLCMGTAAGAGDTRMDKMKQGLLGSSKPGASSDNFANILEWRWSHRSREGRSKLHSWIPFIDSEEKLQCTKPSMFTVSFILQQPCEVLIAPFYE